MTRKRGNNEGSIRRRKNGSWRAQVTLDGRRLSYTAKTRKECHDWNRKILGEIDQGLTFANTHIVVEEYLDNWLAIKKTAIQDTTWSHYTHLVLTYICPSIGRIRLRNLRPNHIQSLYDHLLSKNVGDDTVRKIHTVLHSALTYAVQTGLVNNNPVSATIPPALQRKEMKTFSDLQVSQMLIAAKGHRWEALYHLAVTTGMRQMEILGLKWKDINWVKQTIQVERQLVRPKKGEEPKFAPPKTRNGKRSIALGSKSIEVLRRHNQKQLYEINKAGKEWAEHDLVFTSSSGRPIHYSNLLRNFKVLLRNARLPEIRFHDLRHTAATLMLNHGIPVIIVSQRLGHARPSITLDIYGHHIPSMQSEAAELMDDLVTPIELHQVAPGCTRLHQEILQK